MKHTIPVIIASVIATSTVGCFVSNADPPAGVDVLNTECEYHVYRHDPVGWLLNTPVITFDFWGGYFATTSGINDSEVLQTTWAGLFASDTLYAKVAEYGISNPILNSNYNQYSNPNMNVLLTTWGVVMWDDSGTNVQSEINGEIQRGQLPEPTLSQVNEYVSYSNTVYVIVLPPNTTTKELVNYNAVGYHGHGSWGTMLYAYAIISYNSYDFMDSVISHELYEASTNPGNGTGYFDDTTGMEVSDICNWVEVQSYDTVASTTAGLVNVSGINVQKVWSQDTCQCH